MCIRSMRGKKEHKVLYNKSNSIASIKILLSSINEFLKKITVRFRWVLYL